MTMAQFHILVGPEALDAPPAVRRISVADLKDALARGVDDFVAMPSHALFLCLIYPVVGVALAVVTFGTGQMSLFFPMAAGFALLGPLAAIGLYDLSRQRERGLPVDLGRAFEIIHHPSFGAIVALGLLLTAIFFSWLAVAQWIYVANFGPAPVTSFSEFARAILTTPEGWRVIILGNAVGFLFALVVLTISVVSFPLLLDRDVGAAEALVTSYRAVRANPVVMAIWGLIVAVALLLGSLPFLVGLAVVLPVLGHATWHLYRKVVVPDLRPRLEDDPRPPAPKKRRRYAAQFPASLLGGEDRT
jgi:uncharacterized membrane protein